MPTEIQQRKTQLSRALVGNLLLFPRLTLKAVEDHFSPDHMAPAERRLFLGAQAAYENNGRGDDQINPGSIVLEGKLDPTLYENCLDLASCVSDASRQARELGRIHLEDQVRQTAKLLSESEGDNLDSYLLELLELGAVDYERSTPRAHLLAEILNDPDILKPPESVVNRLAWRSRATLLAGREKLGKSTLATSAGAAVSTGSSFLGKTTSTGIVLLVDLEEHQGDIARRFTQFNSNPDNIYVLDRVESPITDLKREVARISPDLVILDTLPAWVQSLDLDASSSSHWTPVMSALVRIARDYNTALLILHHATKGSGDYRDSTAIAASVDVLITMKPGRIPNTRTFNIKARWPVEDFSLQFTEEAGRAYYEISRGCVSVDALVLAFVKENPGCSSNAIREGVEGQNQQIDAARYRLLKEGLLDNQGNSNRHSYYRAGNPIRPDQGALFDYTTPTAPPHGRTTGRTSGRTDDTTAPQLAPPIGGQGACSSEPQEEDYDLPF